MKILKVPGVLIVISVLIPAGCSEDNSTMNRDEQAAFSVSPSDNAVNVRLDEKVVLNFAKPVSSETVNSNFHLISEKDMADSACPYGMSMMHGDMNNAMMDSAKMNHLISRHHTRGRFNWNSDSTNCTFTPDSLLLPDMNYMMHFGDEMIDMMQERMGQMMGGMTMGGMPGMGTGNMTGHMMLHFTTMDTTNSGSGHDEHH